MADKFQEFLTQVRQSRNNTKPIPQKVLSIDPGGTTGWAMFAYGEMYVYGKESNWHDIICKIIAENPDFVACEEYRIYSGARLAQAYSPVNTVRIIGAIEHACYTHNIPLCKQMASGPKAFVTDNKLKDWGYWVKNDHIRDAIRHGCYALLFNKEM